MNERKEHSQVKSRIFMYQFISFSETTGSGMAKDGEQIMEGGKSKEAVFVQYPFNHCSHAHRLLSMELKATPASLSFCVAHLMI